MTTPESTAPTMPIDPKEMKYWITSCPVEKPAPTTSPTKASAVIRTVRMRMECFRKDDEARPDPHRDAGRARLRTLTSGGSSAQQAEDPPVSWDLPIRPVRSRRRHAPHGLAPPR